jgi:hypothetical protein
MPTPPKFDANPARIVASRLDWPIGKSIASHICYSPEFAPRSRKNDTRSSRKLAYACAGDAIVLTLTKTHAGRRGSGEESLPA